MPIDNIDLTRRAWQAAANGDRDGFTALMHPDITWYSMFGLLANQSSYHGPEEVAKLVFEEVPSVLGEYNFEPLEIQDLGNDTVLTVFNAKARTAAGAVEIEQQFVQIVRIRDGKAFECRAYTSKAEALEAVGPKE